MTPRDAATVIVLRDAGALEVFCVLRHQKSAFMGGAVVFPGGKLDAADGAEGWALRSREPLPRALDLAEGRAETARALAIAACRETLEEGGILPLDPPVGAAQLSELRRELAGSPGALLAALGRLERRLLLDELVPFARWITPEAEQRRFDARFYLLELPAGQEGRHDDHETTQSFWARPADVLVRAARGEIFLAPPTTRSLELLADARDVAAARALAERQALRPICPLFAVGDDGVPFLALPGDPAHAVRELRVAGPTRFVLRDGRFVSEEAPAKGGAGAGGMP